MKKILFTVITVMIFSVTANAQQTEVQQPPVAVFTNLPPIGGAERGLMYLLAPPNRDFGQRSAPGEVWTISETGILVRTFVSVLIINVSAGVTWDETFSGTYPKLISGAIEVSQRRNDAGLPLVDKKGNPLVTYRVTM